MRYYGSQCCHNACCCWSSYRAGIQTFLSHGNQKWNVLLNTYFKQNFTKGKNITGFVVAMDSRQESDHTHYKPLSEDHADLRNLKNFAVSLINYFRCYCETIHLSRHFSAMTNGCLITRSTILYLLLISAQLCYRSNGKSLRSTHRASQCMQSSK